MKKLNSFESLGNLFGVQASEDQPIEDHIRANIDFNKLDLRIALKRLGGGKQVSIVSGFAVDQDLNECSKELKLYCGTGGSVKDATILIQGNHREKIKIFFLSKGAKIKLAGG